MNIAALPMYDLPEVRWATDAWWQGLARHFRAVGIVDVPGTLTRIGDYRGAWSDKRLLFGQTCSYPLATDYRDRLSPLAVPCYAAPGCEGSDYASHVVVRSDDDATCVAELRDRRAAFNNRDSQSGYNSLRALIAPQASGGRFFSRVDELGGHVACMEAIAAGDADVAAIDCVTFALVARHRPHAVAGLRILARTPTAPALPYVTRREADPDLRRRLRLGLDAALADPELADCRDALLLTGAEELTEESLARVTAMEREAQALGYPSLG
jgi:ABC-type phosphate/phosphonate transport system substrate-binding protein